MTSWRPQVGDGAEDSAPTADEERDDAPHGELGPGKRVSIGCSNIVVESVGGQAAG